MAICVQILQMQVLARFYQFLQILAFAKKTFFHFVWLLAKLANWFCEYSPKSTHLPKPKITKIYLANLANVANLVNASANANFT